MNLQRDKYRNSPIESVIKIDASYVPSQKVDYGLHNASYYSEPFLVIDQAYGKNEQTETAKGGIMFSLTKTQFAIAILTFLGAMIVAAGSITWSLSNHINNSANEVRKELQDSMNLNRQEIVTAMNLLESRSNDRLNRVDSQFEKTDSRIDKLESKIDDNFKDTNKNINELKELIIKSK
ncbi:hypothetical protein AB7V88_20825 [Providencia rettgeri]